MAKKKSAERPDYLVRALRPTSSRRSALLSLEQSPFAEDTIGMWFLGSILVLLPLTIGSFQHSPWVAAAVVAMALAVALGMITRAALTYRKKTMLIPGEAEADLGSVHVSARILRSHHTKNSSPEVLSLTREGLSLVEEYDAVLTAWTKAAWNDAFSSESYNLARAASALSRSIEHCRGTLDQRLEWEKACRISENAPLVHDAQRIAEAALSRAALADEQFDQADQKALLQQQVLASLQGSHSSGMGLDPTRVSPAL